MCALLHLPCFFSILLVSLLMQHAVSAFCHFTQWQLRSENAPEFEGHTTPGKLVDIQSLEYTLHVKAAMSLCVACSVSWRCSYFMLYRRQPALYAFGPMARTHHMQLGLVSFPTDFAARRLVYIPLLCCDIARTSRQASTCMCEKFQQYCWQY